MKLTESRQIDISCIVPVYNTADYIEKCIYSIMEQHPVNVELICIDDASTDNSSKKIERLIERYPNCIKLITNQTNKGVSYCRNIGIKLSRGQYISFVDSDDWISTDFYSNLLKQVHNTQSQIGTGSIHRYNNNSKKVTSVFSKWELAGIDPADYFIPSLHCDKLLKMNPSVCDSIFCRSLFIDNEIAFPELPFAEDLYCFFELFQKANRVCHTRSSVYFYRAKRDGSVISDRCIDYISPLIHTMHHIVFLYSQSNEKIGDSSLPAYIIEKLYSSYRRLKNPHKKSCYFKIQSFIESLPDDIKTTLKRHHLYMFFKGSWTLHRWVVLLDKFNKKLKKLIRNINFQRTSLEMNQRG